MLLGGVMASPPAEAGPLGSLANGAYSVGSVRHISTLVQINPNPFPVGAGQDATMTVAGLYRIDVDFSASALVLTMPDLTWSAGDFHGALFGFSDLSPFPQVLAISASGREVVSAFMELRGPSLLAAVNWQGQTFAAGDTINVTFATFAVPEPGSAVLLAAGLLGLGVVGGRRFRRVEGRRATAP